VVDWLNAIEVCGRLIRVPGPTLLAKLLLDALRDVVREFVEDTKDVLRAPTNDVPFTVLRGDRRRPGS